MSFGALLVETGRRMARAPLGLKPLGWLGVAAYGCVVAVTHAYRFPLQGQIQGRGGPAPAAVAAFVNVAGSGYAVTGLVAGGLLLGLVRRNEALVQAAAVISAAGLYAFAALKAGQFVLAEARPVEGGAMHYFALNGHGISGHAVAAGILVLPLSAILARRATRQARGLVATTLSLWLLVVAWSRVFLGMHFVWNVCAGAALGLWAGAAGVAAWRGGALRPRTDSA
jgi:membrane-associated phospholipid phosphatase